MDLKTQHQRGNRLATKLLKFVIRELTGIRGTVPSQEVVNSIVSSIFPSVLSTRESFRLIARESYEDAKREAIPDKKSIPPPKLREYTRKRLKEALSANLPDNREVNDKDIEKTLLAVEQQARDAERNQTVAYAIHDKDIKGWARIDPEPPTCSFCLLLVSRGPVYRSAHSAGDRNKYHHGCTCIPVLVFNGQSNWRGEQHYKEALAIYKQAKGDPKKFREIVDTKNGNPKEWASK